MSLRSEIYQSYYYEMDATMQDYLDGIITKEQYQRCIANLEGNLADELADLDREQE